MPDTLSFDTISNLKNFDVDNAGITTGQSAIVSGYNQAGDDGGSAFYWDANSTESDNGIRGAFLDNCKRVKISDNYFNGKTPNGSKTQATCIKTNSQCDDFFCENNKIFEYDNWAIDNDSNTGDSSTFYHNNWRNCSGGLRSRSGDVVV